MNQPEGRRITRGWGQYWRGPASVEDLVREIVGPEGWSAGLWTERIERATVLREEDVAAVILLLEHHGVLYNIRVV